MAFGDWAEPRKITILYGSQTGTAEEIAERLWRESKRMYWSGPVLAMDRFEASKLANEKILVFVCSTTGQGEEPDNMKTTWKFLLKKNLPSDLLATSYIAVLGLGDSSYARFNFVAKRLYKRLLQLGAHSLLELGLANDQHDLGVDAVANPWIKALWQALGKKFPLDDNLAPLHLPLVSRPRYSVHLLGTVPAYPEDTPMTNIKSIEPTTPVVENIRTTSPDHFQDVRLLTIKAPDFKYKPGDVLQVYPSNSEQNIKLFLDLFRTSASAMVFLAPAKAPNTLPLPLGWEHAFPCSLEDCARRLLDLQAPPQRYALQVLAHFTASALEKERLLEFSSPEGQQEFIEYCIRPKRTMLEILQEFPVATLTLPLPYLFDLFKPIHPRLFSIASAQEMSKGVVQLLVAVVRFQSRLMTPRLGLCSTWMARLKPGEHVPCCVRPGSFKFPPAHLDIPLILVGPGTGCAPFRSLVQQRCALGSKGRLILFLGFRNKHGDYHCQEEWQAYEEQGLIQLFVAFSRDQENKEYVQHKIVEQGALICKLLVEQHAGFYVAGNAKNMPASVREAVLQVVRENKPCSQEEAELYVTQLEVSRRYQTETW